MGTFLQRPWTGGNCLPYLWKTLGPGGKHLSLGWRLPLPSSPLRITRPHQSYWMDTTNWEGIRQQGCSYKMNQDPWGSKVSLWGPTTALTAQRVMFIESKLLQREFGLWVLSRRELFPRGVRGRRAEGSHPESATRARGAQA